jgi:hypothetical protein
MKTDKTACEFQSGFKLIPSAMWRIKYVNYIIILGIKPDIILLTTRNSVHWIILEKLIAI